MHLKSRSACNADEDSHGSPKIYWRVHFQYIPQDLTFMYLWNVIDGAAWAARGASDRLADLRRILGRRWCYIYPAHLTVQDIVQIFRQAIYGAREYSLR